MCFTEFAAWISKKMAYRKISYFSTNLELTTYVSAFCAYLLLVTCGNFMVWTSPVIPKLKSNNTNINPLGVPITTLHVSIIAATPNVAAVCGCFFMSKILDKIGRKKTMLLLSISVTVALSGIAFSKHIYFYFVFFIVMGINDSGLYITIPIYNTEISDSNTRGRLDCLLGLALPIGFLTAYIIGPLVSVKAFTLISAIPAITHLLLSHAFVIESPIYLASRGKKEETIRSLKKLRTYKTTDDIQMEYESIQEEIHIKKNYKKRTVFDLLKERALRKALYLSVVIWIGQQTSGISVIMAFVGPIFNEAGATLSGNAIGVILGFMTLVIYVISYNIIERSGRRPLLLLSSISCSVFTAVMSFYFYLKYVQSPFADNMRWLAVVFVMLFIIGYGLGLGPIPITILGDLFPNDVRSLGVATVLFLSCIINFVVNFSFPLLSETYGVHSCLLTHACCNLLTFLILYFLLPETKGKSISEIQNLLDQ